MKVVIGGTQKRGIPGGTLGDAKGGGIEEECDWMYDKGDDENVNVCTRS